VTDAAKDAAPHTPGAVGRGEEMNIQEFAEMTNRIIARDGFDNYLPTLCIPMKRYITVLEGVPEDEQIHIREIALEWAEEKTEPSEEYFLVYKENSESFRIIHQYEGGTEEKSFSVNSFES